MPYDRWTSTILTDYYADARDSSTSDVTPEAVERAIRALRYTSVPIRFRCNGPAFAVLRKLHGVRVGPTARHWFRDMPLDVDIERDSHPIIVVEIARNGTVVESRYIVPRVPRVPTPSRLFLHFFPAFPQRPFIHSGA